MHADNAKSCAFEVFSEFHDSMDWKNCRSFWNLQIWSKNSNFARENLTLQYCSHFNFAPHSGIALFAPKKRNDFRAHTVEAINHPQKVWIWDLGSGIWDLGSGIWDLGSGTWGLGSGVWNRKVLAHTAELWTLWTMYGKLLSQLVKGFTLLIWYWQPVHNQIYSLLVQNSLISKCLTMVSIRQATPDDLILMQTSNLWCLPEK